jgi:hypothetical protein
VSRHARGRRARSDHLYPWFRRCGDGTSLVSQSSIAVSGGDPSGAKCTIAR